MKNSLIVLLILSGILQILGQKCQPKDYGNGGTVCVCNANHCDTVEPVKKLDPGYYVTYTSNKEGLRFEKEEGKFGPDEEALKNIIIIRQDGYQEVLGWGGTFTDAAGININSLPSAASEKLMRSYFSEEGIEYNLCRVPLGASDFSAHPYSYHDEEDDQLPNFKLAEEDYTLKIPLIRKAMELTDGDLKLFTSAWIAPKWMKENGEYSGMFGFLKESKYQVWANYFRKFLDEYKKENITFWGITTGNEPSLGLTPAKIPSVAWTVEGMVNIICADGATINVFPKPVILEKKEVSDYIDGVAVHWYTDLLIGPDLLSGLHEKHPDKFILGTEACLGATPFGSHVILGSWLRGEYYAKDIIQDLNHWATGWVDWNLALNLTGGPTYIDNFVDSPIIVNASSGEFYKQPTFYARGHFSKFIPRGSVRIYSSQFDDKVPVTAFRRPDGGVAIIILNQYEHPVKGKIFDIRRGEIVFNLSSKSLTSLLYW
nr:putative glucosylceramidase 3 [Leptinotarsa decemlineata]